MQFKLETTIDYRLLCILFVILTFLAGCEPLPEQLRISEQINTSANTTNHILENMPEDPEQVPPNPGDTEVSPVLSFIREQIVERITGIRTPNNQSTLNQTFSANMTNVSSSTSNSSFQNMTSNLTNTPSNNFTNTTQYNTSNLTHVLVPINNNQTNGRPSNQTTNLPNVTAPTNQSNQTNETDSVYPDKATITYDKEKGSVLFKNTFGIIPLEREDETAIVYCKDAETHQQIGEGCGEIQGVTEKILTIEDPELSLSRDGQYLLLEGLDPGGAMPTWDNLARIRKIKVHTPRNNSANEDGNLTITFRLPGMRTEAECRLYLDEEFIYAKHVTAVIKKFRMNTTNISVGDHKWKINCTDTRSIRYSTGLFDLTVLYIFNFSGQTTDLSKVEDIENVSNFTLEKVDSGLIRWDVNVNLSGGADFNRHIDIGHNLVILESEHLPMLNFPAKITLYNLDIQRPVILRDGEFCEECQVLNPKVNITFQVEHFSSYVVSENSRLYIKDSTDTDRYYKDQTITFFANYSNTTSEVPIQGGGTGCNITFPDTGTSIMTYGAGLKQYTYSRSFDNEGVYYYDVACHGEALDYTNLETTDYSTISRANEPVHANVELLKSEKGVTPTAKNPANASAGNITELEVNTVQISKNWQGYYGNVTGELILSDADGNNMYLWNVTNPSGEVYASRAFDISFTTINCTNTSGITNEETYLEQWDGDSDRVNNTFNRTTHPSFLVGIINITANSCPTTNINVNGTYQIDQFYEILLTDGATNLVYTAILEDNKYGFNKNTTDFQLIVGEFGKDSDSERTPYYFFVEL